jgi:fucose 4-O-acetylase-like acetyltransferase
VSDSRRSWIDIAKGIGILLVVYGHVAEGVFKAGIPFDRTFFRAVDVAIYSFHMPLFFFLSGLFFFSSWENRGTRGLLASKVNTLVYPYVLWSLLQGSVEILLEQYTNKHATVNEVMALLWEPRQQFWFLYALFFIFVASCLAYSIAKRRWLFAVPLAAAVAFLCRDDVPFIWPLKYLAMFGVYFAIGASYPGLAQLATRASWKSVLLLGVAFLAGQVVYQATVAGTLGWENALLALPIGLAGIAWVAAGSATISGRSADWLTYLGRASLGIYLMHTMAASGTRIILQKLLGVESLPLHLVLGTFAGIIAPLCALKLLERWQAPGVFTPPRRWALRDSGPGA